MTNKSSTEASATEKKLDVEPLDPVLEVNENIPSEVFDRPREENEIEEISPRIFTLKTITEPLTLRSLKNAIYELGVVNLCWPEITEPVFETRTCFPKSYYTNSPKERLLLAYAENFRRQFHFHYHGRKPLLLQAPNECGLQKMVCTSIRPTKLCYADTSTWQGLSTLVCDFFDYEPLTKPMLHKCFMLRLHACRNSTNVYKLLACTSAWLPFTRHEYCTLVCSGQANMADVDVEVVSAIAFGLTYFYSKFKEQQRKRKVRHRRCWMLKIHRNRDREFMENKFNELLNEPSGEFHNFCRMSYSDFEFLLSKISPIVAKRDTDWREAIPAKYRLAITLRFLASGESYRSLHDLFKVSVPAISKIVRDVCQALNEVLKDEVKMPSTAEGWMILEEGYRSKFPHCLGSLDAKHVVIESPTHIVLLTLVDSQYRFIFADIGSQERITDGGVFNNSLLWQRICSNEIDFPPPCPLPGSDVNVPYVFLADSAFALSTHVMTPYPGSHVRGSPKRKFNQMLSRSRVVIENTFGILTSIFRIFRRPINLNPKTVSIITMTCVLLHNYLRRSETSSSRYTPPGSFDVYDNNGILETPGFWRRHDREYNALQTLPSIPRSSPLNAQQIRKEFTTYFYRNI